MRLIYTDEAGISAREPVTIVAGIILHADRHYLVAQDAIREILRDVPAKHQEGFQFHAKTIWGNDKYRPEHGGDWSFEQRFLLLKRMMSLPRLMQLGLAFAMERRESYVPEGEEERGGLSREQFQHARAFGMCIAYANQYIKENATMSEVAKVVAEDVPSMRSHLRAAFELFRSKSLQIPDRILEPRPSQKAAGIRPQSPILQVNRIVDTIFFEEKKGHAPLLAIADAVAFGLRRYFSGQKHGLEFAQAIFGARAVENEKDLAPTVGPCMYAQLAFEDKKQLQGLSINYKV